jgi:hypothetical protein
MPFETFTKRMIPVSKAPFVTVQKRGTLSFNAAAHALLGSPEYLELLFDPENQIIGFRAATDTVQHAYPIRPVNANKSGTGTYVVSGRSFTHYYKIDTETARRFNVHLDGDILCLDLKGPSAEVTGNRKPKREETDFED